MQSIADTPPAPAAWSTVELRGGPYDGQTMRVPDDLDTLILRHNGREHLYQRLGNKPQMHHQRLVAQWFGKGGKR